GRIIGGREAEPHSRPYMAYLSIQSESGHFACGGFLIRPDAVVSAAHCVAGKRKVNVTVILGAHNIKWKELSWQEIHVGHWVIHRNYSGDTYKNDIMLLKLKSWANVTDSVNYIHYAKRNERVKPGTICEVAGWGWTSMSHRGLSHVLMEVDLEVERKEMCTNYFKHYHPVTMICAGDENWKKSAYRGDSGGPLVCNGKAHGIVSHGAINHILPTVFTRVSYFDSWIRTVLRKFELQDLPDSP
ncbi:MCPT3 protease, partial [Psophia crepitans]|nr:MCPT3 protease [Psophia crepitans]